MNRTIPGSGSYPPLIAWLAVRARIAPLLIVGLLFAPACSRDEKAEIARNIAIGRVQRNDPKQLVSIQTIQVFPTVIGPLVVGEVKNLASGPVSGVSVTATLKNQQGKVIGELTAFSLLDVIPPGGASPFFAPFTVGKTTAASVDAKVDASEGGVEGNGFLEIAEDAGGIVGPLYEVTGVARNRHSQPVRFPKVVATFYDGSGRIIGAAFSYLESDVLKPGESAPFRMVLQERHEQVARYALLTEARMAEGAT